MRRLAGRMGIDIETINTLYVLRLRAADNPALQDAAERLKRYLQEHHKLVVADVYNHGVVAFCDDKLFDEAEADVAVNRAAVKTARINLEYTKVRSPISGRIGKSAFTPGALVTANQAQAPA